MSVNGWSPMWICILLIYGVGSLNFSPNEGFIDKLKKTRQQLMNNVYQNSRDKKNFKMDTSMLWSDPLQTRSSSDIIPTIFRTFNHTVMINDMDVYVVKDEVLNYKITLIRYFNYKIQLVKGFEWQERLFLLFCFEHNGVCSLYSVAPDLLDATYHHSISHNGIPNDAQFFVQQEKLYLSILFQGFNCTTSQLMIYQWRHTYMDPEHIPDIISSATSITLFGYKEDVVFILQCPGDEHEPVKFQSQVWRRKESGEIIKVQFLPTENPISITHLVERGENFIMIQERVHETSIFWWEGSEFVRWLPLDGTAKYFKVAVSSNLKDTTFLIFTHSNVVRIYLMTSTKLDEIYEKEFIRGDLTEIISVLSVAVFEENENTYMLVLTRSQSLIYLSLHKVNIQVLDTIASEEPSSNIRQGEADHGDLDNTFNKVKSLKNKMDELDALSSSVLLTNKNATINGVVRVSGEIRMEGGEIMNKFDTRMGIVEFIRNLRTFIKPISEEISRTWKQLNSTHINKKRQITFLGNLTVKKVKINSLTTKTLNENIFEPSSFLFLKTPHKQRLKSVKAKKVNVQWLVASMIGESRVEDLVLSDSRVNVSVTVASMEAKNLRTSENTTINDIKAAYLSKMAPEDDTFNTISKIGSRNNPVTRGTLHLEDNTVIQNLYVDWIDGFLVKDVLSSVFVREKNNVIHGNVHFQRELRTNQLAAGNFNFLEQSGQYPQSRMGVYRPSHPPVHIPSQQLQYNQYRVPQDPRTGERRMKRDDSREFKRIIGKKKIKIIGDLKVAKLLFRNSSLMVNNQSVPTDNLGDTFWTSTTPQKINGSVHFTNGISIESDLESPMVSGKNLSTFASRGSVFNSLVLENVHVDGNITTTGESVTDQMRKTKPKASVFKVLNVNHLTVEKINEGNTKNILQSKDLLNKEIRIMTENLKIAGDLETDQINDVNVTHKFKSAVMTDGVLELNEVEFKNISGNNINVRSLNNHSLNSLSSRESSTVFINGTIHVSQLSEVNSINNYPADLSKVVNKRKGTTIYGKKKFNGQVMIIQNTTISYINNVHFESWVPNLLKSSTDQEVTGFYNVNNAEIKSNLNTSEINGVSLSSFIRTDQPEVILKSDIGFKTITVAGNLTSESLHGSCKLPKMEDDIVFEPSSQWSTVVVSGDSVWPDASGRRLQQLFDSAVHAQGDQTITGNVTIQLLSLPNLTVQSLNDKNITFIFHDTLSRRNKNQVISGKKTFLKSFKCKNIKVTGDAKVESINSIIISDIEKSLVRQNGDDKETIYGHKTFLNGFRAFKLACPAGINRVKEENIVSRHFKKVAPPLVVQSLTVHNHLQVQSINDLNIENFISDCIKLRSTDRQLIKGNLHVRGNVSVGGELTTPSINNITTNDIVFVNNMDPVSISGCKSFLSEIEIKSDPNIEILNDRNLTKTYRENVKTYENVTINGSMVIESEVEVDTIYAREYFVGSKPLVYFNKTSTP